MTKNADPLVVAGTGTVYVATYGATLPTAVDQSLASATWTDLGYTNEDGITFTDEPTIERKNAWQSFFPVRIIETARMAKAEGALLQWEKDAFKLVAGGGSVAAAGSGTKFSPHAAGTISEWSFVVDIADGDDNYRFVIGRGMVTSAFETNLNRTDLSELPFVLEAIGVENVDPWFLLTDDTTSFPADA